jgi:NitT/TauT family transport system substrate-binding protein
VARSLLDRLATLSILLLLAAGCAPSAAPAPASGTAAGATSITAPAAPTNGVSAAQPTAAREAVPVQVGVLSILAEAGLYVALERGYFAEEGLTPEFTTFDTGAKAIPALATGQVDASGGAFSPGFVNATQRGVGVKMVGSLSSYEEGWNAGFIMVRKDIADQGEIRDWADLRGRTIAVPPGRPTVGDFLVARALGRGGLSLADANVVELPFPDMVPAFANGSIDAAHTSEPLSTLAAERGVAVKWHATVDYSPGVTPAVLTYGPSLLQGSADVGQRFMVAYLRGARDYNAAFKRGVGRAEIIQTLTKHTSVKDAAMYDRMGLSYIDPNGTLNLANLTDQEAFYAEFGAISSRVDVQTVVDNRFREGALQRLGPYAEP